ncbi:methyltransferase domain protein [Rhizoctonia solani]|uniref:Methyltransferase domain protein n=1 Tax=Rhizoctonia solani TaxID=456999 RepID=A0A8H8P0C6_9AGAM|nr:methyltransferase domain protein [Rhizoctonia solani]QRW23386.1 methyltransferase domain protein [Rhizoctonia solani]
MPLPFPLEIIPHYIQVVQLGLVPTLRDILSQPSLLLNPPRVSQLFFSHVWLILGPNIDSNNRSTKHELLYPHASGVVIDIGAGHGHTMQYLDRKRVTRYVAIEPNPYMHQQIYKMAEKCGFSIEKGEVVVLGCGAEDIETIREAVGETGKADTVVSILSLCSVRDAKQILGRLLNEVVRSGGEVLWYEHVKNPLASVSFWQTVFSPIWGLAFDGCRMCQDTVGILLTATKWGETFVWDIPGQEGRSLMFHQAGRFVKA